MSTAIEAAIYTAVAIILAGLLTALIEQHRKSKDKTEAFPFEPELYKRTVVDTTSTEVWDAPTYADLDRLRANVREVADRRHEETGRRYDDDPNIQMNTLAATDALAAVMPEDPTPLHTGQLELAVEAPTVDSDARFAGGGSSGDFEPASPAENILTQSVATTAPEVYVSDFNAGATTLPEAVSQVYPADPQQD